MRVRLAARRILPAVAARAVFRDDTFCYRNRRSGMVVDSSVYYLEDLGCVELRLDGAVLLTTLGWLVMREIENDDADNRGGSRRIRQDDTGESDSRAAGG